MTDPPKNLRVPPCIICGAYAFMGIGDKRYCPDHMPGITESEREEFRRAIRTEP